MPWNIIINININIIIIIIIIIIILYYVTEGVCPDNTNTKRLDKYQYCCMPTKIFKTIDEHATCDIKKCDRLRNLQDERQSKFMQKIKNSTVIQMYK